VTDQVAETGESRYGLLIVGGNLTHQENYARAFVADSRIRLVGLCDEPDIPLRRRELNQALADELQVPYLQSLDTALARDDVDLVCLCPEPERRARLTVAAARAGKHVYIDKPLCTSVEGAREVVAAVAAAGVHSQMFSLVRSSIGRRCRGVVESGRLGTLIGLHAELLFAKGISGTADLTRPRREQATAERFTWVGSKRELFCVGLYPLVLFQWLTGCRVESVEAATANFFFQEHQANGAEDFSSLLLGLEGGVEATITVGRSGWSSHPSHGIHQVHLVGTDASVSIDAYRPRLEVFSDAAAWRQPEVPHPEDPMGFWSSTQEAGGVIDKTDWWPLAGAARDDAAYFLDCLDADRESDVPVAVGAHAVETILAGYAAAASGGSAG
jgi:predicted dehydrogenase